MNNKHAQPRERRQKVDLIRCRMPLVGTPWPSIRDGRASCSPIRACGGVTLVELMMVLTVVVILVGIAIPAVGNFVRNSRLTTQANDFVADLAYARSEAIKRGANVVVCKSIDTTTASPPSCSAGGDAWATGRLIFAENIATTNGALDAGEEILRIRIPLEGSNTLNGGANVAANIVFTRTGLTTLGDPANPGDNSFALCNGSDTASGRAIDIAVTGRPTLRKNPQSCNPPWP